LPRYRRLLSFGDVLDESMLLFRKHWVNFALVSAISLFPPGLLLVGFSAAGMVSRSFSVADLQSGRLARDPTFVETSNSQLGVTMALLIVTIFFSVLWSGAIVVTADAYMRGEAPKLGRVYRRALSRYVVLFIASLVFTIAMVGLFVAGTVLFIVTLLGLLGSLVMAIGLLFWWLRPSARSTWLKWLIILTAPFGLPIYFGVRWGMLVPVVVLEDSGPIAALSRSWQITDRHWFRVAAILTVASLIVYILLSVIELFVTIPLYVFEFFRGQFGLNPAEAAISSGAGIVVQILCASMGSIVYTLLFVDLRNRREGTDIAERLSQLEASPIAANG
jgi:hypothetical protein